MKLIILFAIALASLSPTLATQNEPDDKTMSVHAGISPISGTTLHRWDTVNWPTIKKTPVTRQCAIGYLKKPNDNSKHGAFTAILELPSIKDDFYEIAVNNGKLTVTTKNTGSKVVILNLRNVAPTTLTE